MYPIIGLDAVNRISKIASIWLLAACLGILAPSLFVSSAWAGFPCEDVNNDGACTELVDNDITADIMSGYFSTSEGIVIPADAKGLSSKGEISLFAGKDITVNSKLKSSGIMLGAGGNLTIGNKASLKGKDYVDLSAEQHVVVGYRSSVQSQKGGVSILSWEGYASVGERANLSARDGVEITALAHEVSVLPKSRLFSPKGDVRLNGAGDVTVTGSRLQANGTSVQSGGSLLDFTDNSVKVSGGDGWVYLSVLGSTVDLCGTQFKNLDSANLTIDAETVNCMP